ELAREDALALLRRHSLVRLTADDRKLTVHRVLARQVRDRMTDDERTRLFNELALLLQVGTYVCSRNFQRSHREGNAMLAQVWAFAHHALEAAPATVYAVAATAAELEDRIPARAHRDGMLDVAINAATRAFGPDDARLVPLLMKRALLRRERWGG